jgi:hypothetical protein
MREWSTLAPYNFVHAMRLPAPADVGRWQAAADAAVQRLTEPGKIRVEEPANDIESHIEAELQRPFSPNDPPFRFFVIDAGTDGHWFGAAVNHWIADDFSCRVLLHRIYGIYQEGLGGSSGAQLEWSRPSRQPGPFRAWYRFFKESMRMRRACRTSFGDPMDFKVQTFRATFPDGALGAIRVLARETGVTVNDMLLAATAQAFGAAREWKSATRRDAVAVASAMDLRRFGSDEQRQKLGLHIGYYISLAKRPHELPLPEVIREIAFQTTRLKGSAGTELFGPALWSWRRSHSDYSKATIYSRGVPAVAGLSNVNLTGSWIEQADIREFRRFAATGPIVPMVLMITTFRGEIFIDVTFRTTVFAPAQARALIDDVIRRLCC